MSKLLVICGPTATGKTTFASSLAKQLNGELISADSRQVYRGMDLVTGKDRPGVPIWLYDVVDPDEAFSVSQWVILARDAITHIRKRNKLPIVVGGTGLYIQALLKPFDTIDIPPNPELRKKLQHESVHDLQTMLSRGNMNESDWNNPRRLIRKIEISQSTYTTQSQKNTFDYFIIGLTAPLPIIDKRIDERLRIREREGMDKEIAMLRARYDAHLPSMSAINLNEHAYARRQLTWFKKQKDIHWFNITVPLWEADAARAARTWYTKGNV